MKTYIDCYPCLLRQALRAARLVHANEAQLNQLMQQTLSLLQHQPENATPPEIAYQIQRMIQQNISENDPYLEKKQLSTMQSLLLYPEMKQMVSQSSDPLAMAIRISIAGNIIDYGVSDQIADLRQTLERIVNQPYVIDDSNAFRTLLKSVDYLLFLADNAGETVFDRVLIEELPLPVIYAVKDRPILNDATMEDAISAGLNTCATLISTGSQAQGIILSLCSQEFHQTFNQAPLIIAKGQANYETLSDNPLQKIFFLLQVKCPVLGLDFGAPEGSIVFLQNGKS